MNNKLINYNKKNRFDLNIIYVLKNKIKKQ